MPVINANRVDTDQMLHSTASDLDLHCLPVSHLWDARHKPRFDRKTVASQMVVFPNT